MRSNIGIEEIIRVIPDPEHRDHFAYEYQNRTIQIRASNPEEAMAWMHAIETAKRGCFENVDQVLATITSQPSETPSQSQPAKPQSPASRADVPLLQRSPYYLLKYSKVRIDSGSSSSQMNLALPPPVVMPPCPAVDLSEERKVLDLNHN